jgi:hypothetical protein
MADTTPQVPPVPYKVPMTNDEGYPTDAWGKFFRQLFERISIAVSSTHDLDFNQGPYL